MNDDVGFTVHHLRFEVETTTPLALTPPAGAKLRAALYQAMSAVCPLGGDADAPPEHKAACPVCWLLATEKPGHQRGKDLPRPMTVEPPLDLPPERFETGRRFTFGLSLFAQAANLFPYLALGVPEMGRRGLGQRLHKLDGERGRFTLRRAEAVNPLTEARQALLETARGPLFQVPAIPVTAGQVAASTERQIDIWRQRGLDGPPLHIDFMTPTRLISEGQLVHQPEFLPLFARLFDRLGALSRHYADGSLARREAKSDLMAQAETVQLVTAQSRWRDVHSYSRRQRRRTPVGGFVGQAVYRAALETWQTLLPYLLWGQSIHVGKSATRGDGWYQLGLEPQA